MMSKVLGIIIIIVGFIIMLGGIWSRFLFPFSTSLSSTTWVLPIIGGIVLLIGTIITTFAGQDDFRPDNKTLKIADHHPCPVCGKEDYTWGVVGGPQAARFRTKPIAPVWSGKPIMARTCDSCGHLDLFINRQLL